MLQISCHPTSLSVNFGVRTIHLRNGESIRFGRTVGHEVETPSNGLFNCRVISTTHAILLNKDQNCLIEDKSKNGSFINGVRLRPKYLYNLIDGDIIEFGMAAFLIEVKVPGIMIDLKIHKCYEDAILDPPLKLLLPSNTRNKIQLNEGTQFTDSSTSDSGNSYSQGNIKLPENVNVSQEICPVSNLAGITCLENFKVNCSDDCSIIESKLPPLPKIWPQDKLFSSEENKKVLVSVGNEIVSSSLSNDKWVSMSNCHGFLNLYLTPPMMEYPLEKMYEVTLERYHLLQVVSQSAGNHLRWWGFQFVDIICNEMKQHDFPHFNKIINGCSESERQSLVEIDVVSHFTLKAACSYSYEALKWFIQQETKLLFVKWCLSSLELREQFIKSYNFDFNPISVDERKILLELYSGMSSTGDFNFSDLYKVKFDVVSNLIRNRTVPLLLGYACLSHDQLIHAVNNSFMKYLKTSLVFAKERWQLLPYNPQIMPFFKKINKDILRLYFRSKSFTEFPVKLSQINELSKKSFPLCMELLHHYLVKDNHLRNGARFQYNLFLKALGLSLKDSVKFWQQYFLKKMSITVFNRHYLYFIKHGYGMIGKQADYPPLNCNRIMQSVPGPLEHHGCPFLILHKDVIMMHLARITIPHERRDEIWELMQNGMPQNACSRVFDILHNSTEISKPTDHPNIYFNKSRRVAIKFEESKDVSETNVEAKSQSNRCSCHKIKDCW